MSLSRALWVLLAWVSAMACNPPPLEGPGGFCHSLTDCQVSLVCDRGKCTGDLSRLASQSEDPPFLMLLDSGSDSGREAGVATPDAAALPDAAVRPPDAGVSPPDAAVTPPAADAGQGVPKPDGG